MGVVYRAFDAELGCEIALKMSQRPDPTDLYRLKREFRSRAGISHPNLMQLHDLVVEGNACFFTMELVDAEDFLTWVRGDTFDSTGDLIPVPPTITVVPGDSQAVEAVEPGVLARPVLPPEAQERLRDGLRQLLPALAALHRAGFVHRDVKPGNVLVSQDLGRVVLADFGLATPMPEFPGDDSFEGFPVGSVPYMAPEQATGQSPSPAADLYAVGVMIYEALAGRAPFRGPALRVLHHKATRDPTPLGAVIDDGLPADLEALAMDLLARNPAERPSVEEALARLDRSPHRTAPETSPGRPVPAPAAAFVGRDPELEALEVAWSRVGEGLWTTVHVHGVSGIGKSTLLRRFTRGLEHRERALVLRGRCHPHESVPFKALDAIVDGISHHLGRLSEAQQRAIAPRYGPALRRLFPVLGRVDGLRYAGGTAPPPDPREVRRQGFAGLRELLARLSDRLPVVIWIDDLQWGDLDSGVLLRELVRPPDPPAVLLLLSYRREDLDAPLVDATRRQIPGLNLDGGSTRELALEPLSPQERSELAARLLDRDSASYQRHVEAIVEESQGSPFFLCEMAHYLTDSSGGGGDARSWRADSLALADVVSPRIEALPQDARRLLEVVSVAGRPFPQDLALAAAGLGEGGRPLIGRMVEECLLRRAADHGVPAIAAYHDRIRESAVHLLADARRQRLHRRLAEVLERHRADDLDGLVDHWAGAGESDRAAGYAIRAAERAHATLAFDRAAQMYRSALRLRPDLEEPWELRARSAQALANAGRGLEAAQAYEFAADTLAAASPDDVRVLAWRGRAGEHYVKAGVLDQGWAAMRTVLGDAGVAVPKSHGAATAKAAWGRARLLARGIGYTPTAAEDVPPETTARMDAVWRLASAFAMVNFPLSDALATPHLLEALDLGEPNRIAHALANEAAFEALLEGRFFRRRVDRLMAAARSIWETSPDPRDHAVLDLTLGIIALFDGRCEDVVTHCDAADLRLRTECIGAHWELGVAHHFALTGLALTGRLGELARRLGSVIRDAELRSDRQGAHAVRMGEPAIAHLAADRPDEARRQLSLGTADLSTSRTWPETGYRTQHYHRLVAVVNTALYEGRTAKAFAEVECDWPILKKVGFLRVRFTGPQLLQLRGRAALASGELDVAAQEARKLRRARLPLAKAWGALLQAGLEAAGSRPKQAAAHLATAAAGFEEAGAGLYREAARLRLAQVVGATTRNGEPPRRWAGWSTRASFGRSAWRICSPPDSDLLDLERGPP